MNSFAAGVDIGSTTAKAVVLNEGDQMWTAVISTGASPQIAGSEVLNRALEKGNLSTANLGFIIATGYGRISADFAHKTVTEITCHGRGAHFLESSVRTIIDIGGQDAKIISLGEQGRVVDFLINDKCASGTGRFLESAAQLVLHVPLEDMGRLSSQARTKVAISSTCTVFAQTEIISLLASGERVEDVLAGLHSSIANKVASMARHVGVKPLIMMTGGVAKNAGVVQALRQELSTDIMIPTSLDPQLVGALGAALIAREIIQNGGSVRG